MSKDFKVGMKVRLDGEIGLVIVSPKDDNSQLVGFIQWDTPRSDDIEDWRGLWGSFGQSGGEVLPDATVFRYIKSDLNG